jgi:hypothetical protein
VGDDSFSRRLPFECEEAEVGGTASRSSTRRGSGLDWPEPNARCSMGGCGAISGRPGPEAKGVSDIGGGGNDWEL